MTLQDLEIDNGLFNPLDGVEDVMASNNWIFDRRAHDELIVEVSGKAGSYRLFFVWQEEMNAMQFCCQYSLMLPRHAMKRAAGTLLSINENIWMGHFDIPEKTGVPSFRHTVLMRGLTSPSAYNDVIEDLIDISLALCERYQMAFSLLANNTISNDCDLNLALMDIAGES